MGKRRTTENPIAIQLIRKLADNRDEVRVTASSQKEMMRYDLTKDIVCDSLCEWIDSGKELTATITDKNKQHLGQGMWELYPVIENEQWYVKVRIHQMQGVGLSLLIISVRPYTRKII